MVLRALIWDVDGTIAETERDGHRVAFNQALREHRLPWQWSVAHYADLLAVTGGYERLLHDMQDRPDAPPADRRDGVARAVHQRKNALYAAAVAAGGIGVRPGVIRLVDACGAAGIALGVATTTGRLNVHALFDSVFGPRWPARFGAVVCADDAPRKKPDPMAYRVALQRLGVDAREALAVEDSPNGVRAGNAAGLGVVLAAGAYFVDAAFPPCAGRCADLDSTLVWPGGSAPRADLDALHALHAAWHARSQAPLGDDRHP